jgi:hypothetical protein
MPKNTPRGFTTAIGIVIALVVIGGVTIWALVYSAKPQVTQTVSSNGNTNDTVVKVSCNTDNDCATYCGLDPNYQPICTIGIGTTNTCTCRALVPLTPQNLNSSQNVNFSNVNASTNANTNTSTNTNISTAGWKTYTNSSVGYTVKHPTTWTVKATNELSQIVDGQTVRYISFSNAGNSRSLHLGVRNTSEATVDIWGRTGIGAGDFQAGDTVTIAGTAVQSSKLVYQSKAVEVFYSPVEHSTQPVTIGSYKVSSYFSNTTGDNSVITTGADYQTANTILSTLTFTK